MDVVFFVALLVIFYIFFGYPLLVHSISKVFSEPIKKREYMPSVSLIISAYNEEAIIDEKIKNTLVLEYPNEKLQVIVCSDGSTDRTDEIASSYGDRIRLHRVEGRAGKPECQNQGAAIATGEILVFSDANSMYDAQAIRSLTQNFSDDKVGVVCGELRYEKNNKSHEGLYWKLEKILKEGESSIGSCLGANGAIYAMRKNLYVPVPPEACSDFVEPFFAYAKGYRVVYESRAVSVEEPADNAKEFARKRRIVLNSLQSIYLIREFFNPFRYGWYSLALWSHKMLRWFAFLFLILAFTANLFLLGSPFFFAVFVLQVMFYGLAALGVFLKGRIFSIPYYFVLVNLASLLAVLDFLFGRKIVVWEKVR